MNRRTFFETAGFAAVARTGIAAAPPRLTLACADYLRVTVDEYFAEFLRA